MLYTRIYIHWVIHLTQKETHVLKIKRWKIIFHVEGTPKRAGVAISHSSGIQAKTIIKNVKT